MAFDGSTWPGFGAPKVATPTVPPRTRTPRKPKGPVGPGFNPGRVPGLPGGAPLKKPKYFGPARTPQRIPFGKKTPRIRPFAMPLPRFGIPGLPSVFWDPWTDIPAMVLPKTDYTVVPPAGWTTNLTCGPNSQYQLPPGFAHTRTACSTAVTCLTAQAGFTPGVTTYSGSWPNCSAVNNCLQIVWADTREVSAGVYRGHYRGVFRWQCTVQGPVDPTTDPADWIVPGRPPLVVLPYTKPDPYAQQKPGQPQPFPKPIPFRQLPGLPDPDHEILPGPQPFVEPATPNPVVDPAPGLLPPIPWPQPNPTPAPAPQPGPVYPWPTPSPPSPYPGLPNPSPQPVPPTQPPVLPPYYDFANARIIDVSRTRTRLRPAWQTHRRTQPKKGEKEKKYKMSAAMSALWGATGELTEMFDMIDILYGAIPCQVKYDAGMMVKGRKVDVHRKAAFIAANVQHIDGREVVRLGAKNAFEDRFYGTLSPEKAQYQGSYNAGINNHGGKSIESNQRYRPQAGEQENPVIAAFNAGVDKMLGARPKSHTCCAGKVNTCGKIAFGTNARAAKIVRAAFGRSAEQNFWVAVKARNMISRNGQFRPA